MGVCQGKQTIFSPLKHSSIRRSFSSVCFAVPFSLFASGTLSQVAFHQQAVNILVLVLSSTLVDNLCTFPQRQRYYTVILRDDIIFPGLFNRNKKGQSMWCLRKRNSVGDLLGIGSFRMACRSSWYCMIRSFRASS